MSAEADNKESPGCSAAMAGNKESPQLSAVTADSKASADRSIALAGSLLHRIELAAAADPPATTAGSKASVAGNWAVVAAMADNKAASAGPL